MTTGSSSLQQAVMIERTMVIDSPLESPMFILTCGCCCSSFGGGSGNAGGAGLGPGAVGTSRRQFWGLLLFLAALCSGAYILLYYRATLATQSLFVFPRLPSPFQTSAEPPATALPPFPSVPTVVRSVTAPNGPVHNIRWNLSEFTSAEILKDAIENGSSLPLLTLFTTWSDRQDLELVRNLTMRNWRQLSPFIRPVLFTNSSDLGHQARAYGWDTLPVTRTAVGVPILKFLYMDAMKSFNSTLYAFANGDILFTQSLVDSLLAILNDPSLPLDDKPLLVVGQRINVAMVTEQEASTFSNLTRMAKARGKIFTTMAEDFFITDRRFSWSEIPGVVIGRPAYDNWVVLNAIQNRNVVVDVSQTALAVHQTTRAGNHEGFSHPNASYNDRMLIRMYKRVHYMGGCVDCAPWHTLQAKDGRMYVETRTSKPKHCQ